jgi:undecaprenyl-phosphate 4-deoxy-4-formamido-L-arabinose transferase
VEVAHEERAAGESKYSLYKLIRLNFDLVTGFSLVPLQLFSLIGMFVAAMSLLLYGIVVVQRILVGDYIGGLTALWDRDILQFFLIGVVLFGLGLVGEYVGRIYQQVRQRPRYTIRAVLEQESQETLEPQRPRSAQR